MAKPFRIFFFFIITLLLFATTSHSLNLMRFRVYNVYDYLRRFGHPKGIIPSNVKSYDPHGAGSALEIKLERPCYAEIGGKLFHFDKVIRWKIAYGFCSSQLSGVEVKKLLSWLPVTRIFSDWRAGVVKIHYLRESSTQDGVFMEEIEELPYKQLEETPTCMKANMDWLWMFFVSDV